VAVDTLNDGGNNDFLGKRASGSLRVMLFGGA